MNTSLEEIWDGPLSNIREGIFSTDEDVEIRESLNSIGKFEEIIPLEVVKYLWFMPMFLEWQLKRIAEKSPDNIKMYYDLMSWVTEKVGDILGNP